MVQISSKVCFLFRSRLSGIFFYASVLILVCVIVNTMIMFQVRRHNQLSRIVPLGGAMENDLLNAIKQWNNIVNHAKPHHSDEQQIVYKSNVDKESYETDVRKELDDQENRLAQSQTDSGLVQGALHENVIELNAEGEVEKSLNFKSTRILDMEPIKFLPNYRNPCWFEPIPAGNPYKDNRYGGKTAGYASHLDKVWQNLLDKWRGKNETARLRCLPYFLIGGFPKCGTTDVYTNIVKHHQIEGALFKEPHYWTRWRYWTDQCFWREFMCADGSQCVDETVRCDGKLQCNDGSDEWNCDPPGDCSINTGGCSHYCVNNSACACPRNMQLKSDRKTCIGGTPIGDYVDLFDEAAENIRAFTEPNSDFHSKITGEATPATFWDNHRWRDEPPNDSAKQNEPKVLTIHLIKHILPNVKMIVMVRDPITRLFSDFHYFGRTDENLFHKMVVEGVRWFDTCLKNNSFRACAYEPMDPERPPEGRYWNPVERLRIGLYSQYVRDWISVFGTLKNLLVVRLEDYEVNRGHTLQSMVNFLEIDPAQKDVSSLWSLSARVANSGANKYKQYGSMLNDTYRILTEFYTPYNMELAQLLSDSKFNYSKTVV